MNIQAGNANTQVAARLIEDGLVRVSGVAGPAGLLALARSIATIEPHRDSDDSGVTTIADVGGRVRAGFAGLSDRSLSPHTDRSGVARPPALLLMSCGRSATHGGDCVVVDGKTVYDELAEHHPQAAAALRAPRSAYFGGAGGHLGSVFTSVGIRMTIRLRLDDLVQFSPAAGRWLPVLREVIDRHARTFRLDPGQGYVLDNHRWLHGREAFTGRRVMYRVTGNPLPHLGIAPGFIPSRGETIPCTT